MKIQIIYKYDYISIQKCNRIISIIQQKSLHFIHKTHTVVNLRLFDENNL